MLIHVNQSGPNTSIFPGYVLRTNRFAWDATPPCHAPPLRYERPSDRHRLDIDTRFLRRIDVSLISIGSSLLVYKTTPTRLLWLCFVSVMNHSIVTISKLSVRARCRWRMIKSTMFDMVLYFVRWLLYFTVMHMILLLVVFENLYCCFSIILNFLRKMAQWCHSGVKYF